MEELLGEKDLDFPSFASKNLKAIIRIQIAINSHPKISKDTKLEVKSTLAITTI